MQQYPFFPETGGNDVKEHWIKVSITRSNSFAGFCRVILSTNSLRKTLLRQPCVIQKVDETSRTPGYQNTCVHSIRLPALQAYILHLRSLPQQKVHVALSIYNFQDLHPFKAKANRYPPQPLLDL